MIHTAGRPRAAASQSPFDVGQDSRCAATTVAPQECELTFDVGGAAGGARVLLYRRGDDVARWELALP